MTVKSRAYHGCLSNFVPPPSQALHNQPPRGGAQRNSSRYRTLLTRLPYGYRRKEIFQLDIVTPLPDSPPSPPDEIKERNLQAPSTSGSPFIVQVPDDLGRLFWTKRDTGDVHRDHKSRNKEHWSCGDGSEISYASSSPMDSMADTRTTIRSCPMAVFGLDLLVEFEAISCGFKRSPCSRQIRSVLG